MTPVRSGFIDGLRLPSDAERVASPELSIAAATYQGYYRTGETIVFALHLDNSDTDMLLSIDITGAHLDAEMRRLFLEIPNLGPAHQVHLHLTLAEDTHRDLFMTVHDLAPPFEDYPGYVARERAHMAPHQSADPGHWQVMNGILVVE